jgi:hypothetical protein
MRGQGGAAPAAPGGGGRSFGPGPVGSAAQPGGIQVPQEFEGPIQDLIAAGTFRDRAEAIADLVRRGYIQR